MFGGSEPVQNLIIMAKFIRRDLNTIFVVGGNLGQIIFGKLNF